MTTRQINTYLMSLLSLKSFTHPPTAAASLPACLDWPNRLACVPTPSTGASFLVNRRHGNHDNHGNFDIKLNRPIRCRDNFK